MKRVVAAVIAAAAILAAVPAQASDDHWRGRGRNHDHAYWGPRHRESRVIYGPPIVIHRAPPPVVVYNSPRVIYAPEPVEAFPASPPFTDRWGRYCREYQTTVTVGPYGQPGYGTACLQPDGSWQIVR